MVKNGVKIVKTDSKKHKDSGWIDLSRPID